MNVKASLALVAALAATNSLVAQEAQPSGQVPAEAAEELNKVVATQAPASAKGLVDEDIDAYCREAGIVLGYVKGKDAFYIKGVERVLANVKSPNFVKSRSLAYAKAYQNAVADYVMLKYGTTTAEQYNTLFTDASSDRLEPSSDVKGTMARLLEKTAQLAEAKLDEGLRKMGVTPAGSVTEKRNLMKNAIVRRSMNRAVGSSAGLLPVQTFEGWTEKGQYAVGVVVRGGVDTELLAQAFRTKQRPLLSRPAAGLTVEEALPEGAALASQFGVRMFFDKSGTPTLMSFGQWGSSYAGENEDMAEAALDHAREQAVCEADDNLTMFINSTLSMAKESERSEDASQDVSFDENGVPSLADVVKYVDRSLKSSEMHGSDTMRGRVTAGGFPKVIKHRSGHKVAVCVRIWNFDQYDAMSRTPQPAAKKAKGPSVRTGDRGVSRGKSYDF